MKKGERREEKRRDRTFGLGTPATPGPLCVSSHILILSSPEAAMYRSTISAPSSPPFAGAILLLDVLSFLYDAGDG